MERSVAAPGRLRPDRTPQPRRLLRAGLTLIAPLAVVAILGLWTPAVVNEAIAGVVNVILKKNYTGAELRISYDNTFKSDVGQTTIALTAGAQAGKA